MVTDWVWRARKNKEKALTQIHRVLKDGGKLIIAHALSSAEIRVHHKDVSLAVTQDVLPEEKDMIRLLNCTGFFNVNIHDKPGFYLCTSKKSDGICARTLRWF